METRGFEEIEHTADWSIRVWAPDMAGLFLSAAEGMFNLLAVKPQSQAGVWRRFELHAEDRETLLVSWLEELLFFHETEHLVTAKMEIDLVTPLQLNASIRFVPGTRPKKHIKAVTFHNLQIKQTAGLVQTEIVFDV